MSELRKIFNLYERIQGNKNIVSEIMVKPNDISSSYPNLKFAKRTKNDEINKALLDDLQKASELTGLDITIDFAKTDHNKYSKSGNVSRHWSNQAVDIDYIGGKIVSPSNREIVNKYVDALISMGYVKNSESGNAKAVLTFGFPGHDNHIHVSNKLGSPSTVDPNYEPSSDMDSSDDSQYGSISSNTSLSGTGSDSAKKTKEDGRDTALFNLAGALGGLIGLKENFGKNIQKGLGTISIPGSSNKEINSPIDGVINNSKFVSGCVNQIIIESDSKPKFYLQYCGITRPKVRNGEKVSVGETIGIMDSKDIAEVILLDSSYIRQNLEPSTFKREKGKNEKTKDDQRAPGEVSYYDPALAALIGLPGKIFGNVYDKQTGELKTKKWAKIGDKRPVDPWVIDLIKKPFKKKEQQEEDEKRIKENINRIKGLL
jgi:hypothetical protein